MTAPPIPSPGPRAGAQPRFSRQPRRSGLLSTGCGGIESQGWVPAFAGTTKRGRKPAQQGQQARRRQAGMRCVHAVGPRAGASRNRSNAAWRSRINADAPFGTIEEVYRFLPAAVGISRRSGIQSRPAGRRPESRLSRQACSRCRSGRGRDRRCGGRRARSRIWRAPAGSRHPAGTGKSRRRRRSRPGR